MFCIEYDYCRKCCCRAGAEFAVRRLKVGLGEVAGRRRMRKRRGGGRAGVVYLPRSSVRSLARSKGAVEAAIVSSFPLPYAARRKPKSEEETNLPLSSWKSGLGVSREVYSAGRDRRCTLEIVGAFWVAGAGRSPTVEIQSRGPRDSTRVFRGSSRRPLLARHLLRGW